MRALALTAIRKFELIDLPRPQMEPSSVLVRIAAAGLCGTDLHIYNGEANYNVDASRSPIPLAHSPQILGHELTGWIEEIGSEVKRCQPGDLVVIDQVLSCRSLKYDLCEYCETGDTHQCEFGQEYGITGLPGGFAEFVGAPEINVAKVSPGITAAQAALVEPLGCILHAQDRVDAANTRYTWEGARPIRHVAILGAGPSGLLFLQHLRNVRGFDGEIFVFDRHEARLELARRLGAITVDVRTADPAEVVRRRTRDQGIQYLIEATGNGQALDLIPGLVRSQATLLLYGAGHTNLAPGCLTPWQATELSLVCSAGASGRLTDAGGPEIYGRASRLISEGKIDVACLLSHRYSSLEQLPQAFANDWHNQDFVKAVFLPEPDSRSQMNDQ